MSRRRLVLVVALTALPLVLAVPATGQVRTIKPGTSAAGVDLSGLTVEQAAARLDQTYAPNLQGDMTLGAAGIPWKLTMAQAGLKLDSVRTAKRALYAKAGVTAVPPAIVHSRTAVRDSSSASRAGCARRRATRTIKITVRHIFREHSRNGRVLPIKSTRAAIDAQLDDPAAPRNVHVRLRTAKPKVTFADLARVYNTVVTIDRHELQAAPLQGPEVPQELRHRRRHGRARHARRALRDPEQAGQPRLARAQQRVGGVARRPGHPGRRGEQPAASARWLGIANGVGIHGTAEDWSIGTRASHGCIRMHVADVIDLFGRVPVGSPVLIK